MKLFHLSDLHLGKRVNEFSMIEDQRYILKEILTIINDEKPDAVLIAGDVYDRTVPSEDAMKLWDEFLISLAEKKVEVYAISGNHDSAIRFSDHGALVETTGIHLSPVYDGEVCRYTITDGDVSANIYLLPFIKPAVVRSIFPEEEIADYTDACRVAIEHMDVNPDEINILVAHQFVTGATRCESEEIVVGGLDNVDASVFDCFDYVALGHIHGKQKIGRETLRYCGTPLKYSFSEKDQQKSVTVVELFEKTGGNTRTEVRTVPLAFPHDMREIRGSYEELTARNNYAGTQTEDYLSVTLTDEEDIPDALNRLRVIYPNIMKLQYDNTRTRNGVITGEAADPEETDPKKLFAAFFKEQNGKELNEKQAAAVNAVIEKIFGEEAE